MNKVLVKSIIVLLLGAPMAAFALTGPGEGGGGDAVICEISRSSRTVNLADVHGLLSSEESIYYGKNLGLPFRFEIDTAVGTFLGFLDGLDPAYANQVKQALSKLTFQFVDTVEELDDDGITKVQNKDVMTLNGARKWPCHKQQLAVQDRKTGVVRVVKSLYNDLTVPEQALLRIHEAMINLNPNLHDTTPIRTLTSYIFMRTGFKYGTDAWEIMVFLKNSVLQGFTEKEQDYAIAFAAVVSQNHIEKVENILALLKANISAADFYRSHHYPLSVINHRKLKKFFNKENLFWDYIVPDLVFDLGRHSGCGKEYPGDYIASMERAQNISRILEPEFGSAPLSSTISMREQLIKLGDKACEELQNYPEIEQY